MIKGAVTPLYHPKKERRRCFGGEMRLGKWKREKRNLGFCCTGVGKGKMK